MGLPDDYIADARAAVRAAARRPRQSSLRRSVSTAYYALFHELIADAARELGPARPVGVQAVIARLFTHRDMASSCRMWSNGNAGKWQPLAGTPIDVRLRRVALSFITLQQMRHEADYDTQRRFLKSEASMHVERAADALADWRGVRRTNQAAVFLVSLMHNNPKD
jgi:hypothetical protein